MKKKTYFRHFLLLTLLALLVAVPALAMSSCGEGPSGTVIDPSQSEEIGEGTRSFYFVVKDLEENTKSYHVHTDYEIVGDALLSLGLIEGDNSAGTLYVTKVCGVTCDWNVDGTWWCFFVDGEMSMIGADSVSIVEGAQYEFAMSK